MFRSFMLGDMDLEESDEGTSASACRTLALAVHLLPDVTAELRWIAPNDYPGWDAFVAAERPDPWDDFGWFTVGIGAEGAEGTNNFQVLVATPAAASRAQGDGTRFKGVIVDAFEPDAILATLREYVSGIPGNCWEDILTRLRRDMYWEYEGMHPHLDR
jgi:hypothetical protein